MTNDFLQSTYLTPGTAFEFTWTRAARGLTPVAQSIALVGMQSRTGDGAPTPDQAVRVNTPDQASELFGEGSELALMVATAFATGALFGKMPRLYGVPLAPPTGDATVTQLTISGPASESGRILVRIAGVSVTAAVSAGDDAATMAASMRAAMVATRGLPVIPGGTAGNVLATHRTAGVHGNDVMFEIAEVPAGVAIAKSQPTPGTGAASLTDALDNLLALDVNGIALANHTPADVTAAAAHTAIAWQPTRKRWRHVFLGTTGDNSTAGALGVIDDFSVIVGACKGSPSLPGQITAFLATIAFATGSPNYNLSGYSKAPLYPPAPGARYSPLDVEELLQLGVTPLEAVPNRGDRLSLTRLVTTQRSLSGAPTMQHVDASVSMTAAYLSRQLDIAYKRNFGPDSGNPRQVTADLLEQVRDVIIDTLRAAEAVGYVRKLDQRLAEIQVVEAPSTSGRLLASVPLEPTPQLMQMAFSMNVYS